MQNRRGFFQGGALWGAHSPRAQSEIRNAQIQHARIRRLVPFQIARISIMKNTLHIAAAFAAALITPLSAPAHAETVSYVPMDDAARQMYLKRIIPAPKSADFRDGKFYRISDNCKVEIKIADTGKISPREAAEKFRRIFKKYWGADPDISLSVAKENSERIKPDAYEISADSETLSLESSDMGGAENALKTARQLSESERGGEEFAAYVLPQMKISDEPSMRFRGIHICHFPESTFYEFVRAIRLAAYYKLNYAVIEFWGTYPFKDYPELSWEEHALSRAQIREIKAAADEAGITLIPQFNMLGHASGARELTGKHCALYKSPKLQNHFEPEGWSWCISNPKTIEMLKGAMEDLRQSFGNPPFFHIGFDESYEVGTCALCRKTGTPAELIKRHVLSLREAAKANGARLIMWHDMLLDREDKRWENYNVCGRARQNLSKLHAELPRDIVIADWQYGYPKQNDRENVWPTAKYFSENGFDTLLCPWLNQKGIIAQGKFARENGLFGMLQTTWGQLRGRQMQYIFSQIAASAWGAPAMSFEDRRNRMSFNHHIQQMDWDMKCARYTDSGYSNNEDMLTKYL